MKKVFLMSGITLVMVFLSSLVFAQSVASPTDTAVVTTDPTVVSAQSSPTAMPAQGNPTVTSGAPDSNAVPAFNPTTFTQSIKRESKSWFRVIGQQSRSQYMQPVMSRTTAIKDTEKLFSPMTSRTPLVYAFSFGNQRDAFARRMKQLNWIQARMHKQVPIHGSTGSVRGTIYAPTLVRPTATVFNGR